MDDLTPYRATVGLLVFFGFVCLVVTVVDPTPASEPSALVVRASPTLGWNVREVGVTSDGVRTILASAPHGDLGCPHDQRRVFLARWGVYVHGGDIWLRVDESWCSPD